MKEWKSPIPRTINLIWIGTNPYPDYMIEFVKSFNKYLPEFNLRIWSNNDLNKDNFPKTYKYIQKIKKIHGKQMYDSDGNKMYDRFMKPIVYSKWAQITDLMRLELIYNNGGYYFDINFEILKPLYNILNINNEFVGCNEVPRFRDFHSLSNSFFGAIKKSPILKRMLLKSTLDKIDIYNPYVDNETGPGFLRRHIDENKDNIHIFPTSYFYPFVEEYSPSQKNPPYRKSSKNKCHSIKYKKGYMKLKNNKGYIQYPCKSYPKSYAIKHWNLGKSWLNFLEYYTK